MTDPDHINAEPGFRFDENYLSQTPALQVVVKLGDQYLTGTETPGQWRLPLTTGGNEHV